jgi:hypothetical protein
LPQSYCKTSADNQSDKRTCTYKKRPLKNAVSLIKNTDWYNDLDATRTTKSKQYHYQIFACENAIKELNYLEDKIQEYKDQIRDKK